MNIQGVSINPATVMTGHVVRQFLFLETTLGPMSFELASYEEAAAALRELMQETEE